MAKKSVKTPNKGDLRIPGFKAEAALYASPAIYRLSGRFGGRSRTAELAFFQSCRTICGGDTDCLQCCMCVRRGGHPNTCCF
jgi:hypothetical protein